MARRRIKKFILEEHGVTSIEYALAASAMVVALAASAPVLGSAAANLYQVVANAMAAPRRRRKA